MNEQVLTALEVLRNFAENDFELHRIDVLEKDLTAPPKVEIIDETHQKFNGTIYLKNKRSGHFTRHKGLHRDVWEYFFGKIPDNEVFNVHHLDLNPNNNSPDNLQLLTQADHRRLHAKLLKIKKTCPICGKVFYNSSSKNKCCSLACGVKLRSINHAKSMPSKEKICPTCGKKFIAQYPKKIYCSRDCFAAKKKKVCPICGETFFTSRSSKKIYCSKPCANYANAQHRRH